MLIAAAYAVPAAAQPKRAVARSSTAVPIKPEVKRAFWDIITRGDAAFNARNYEAALAAYGQAKGSAPDNAVADYRIGQVHAAQGDWKAAESAYSSARGAAASDPMLDAKIRFALADIRERQKAYDSALQAWKDYQAALRSQPRPGAHPDTAEERIKRLNERQQLTTDYAEVRARIDKRKSAADAPRRP